MLELFQIPFMQKALLVSVVTGGFFSFLGVYIVLRRIVFVGIALSQIAACGFAFGFLLGFNPIFYSVVFTIIGVTLFSFHSAKSKISRESFIGLTYTVAASIAILFISKTAQGKANILDILSGNILTVTDQQVNFIAIVFFMAAILHYLFYKQFIFLSFDTETAKTCGLKTNWWNFLFYLVLGVTISVSIRIAGVLLSFGYLVIPAISALILTQNIKRVFFVAIICGLTATFLGLYISFELDLPSGPSIITILWIIFTLAVLTTKALKHFAFKLKIVKA
ncbi:MAG: metal ABC transporter permease [bacterium]|nr:metal ABC transporter permease [bacterium]